jgi:hypothetical protein
MAAELKQLQETATAATDNCATWKAVAQQAQAEASNLRNELGFSVKAREQQQQRQRQRQQRQRREPQRLQTMTQLRDEESESESDPDDAEKLRQIGRAVASWAAATDSTAALLQPANTVPGAADTQAEAEEGQEGPSKIGRPQTAWEWEADDEDADDDDAEEEEEEEYEVVGFDKKITTVPRSKLRHRVLVKQCHAGVSDDKKHDSWSMRCFVAKTVEHLKANGVVGVRS